MPPAVVTSAATRSRPEYFPTAPGPSGLAGWSLGWLWLEAHRWPAGALKAALTAVPICQQLGAGLAHDPLLACLTVGHRNAISPLSSASSAAAWCWALPAVRRPTWARWRWSTSVRSQLWRARRPRAPCAADSGRRVVKCSRNPAIRPLGTSFWDGFVIASNSIFMRKEKYFAFAIGFSGVGKWLK
jgi:hypothetical protein